MSSEDSVEDESDLELEGDNPKRLVGLKVGMDQSIELLPSRVARLCLAPTRSLTSSLEE